MRKDTETIINTETAQRNVLETLLEADGRLITLPGVTSLIGEPIVMSVRYGKSIQNGNDLGSYVNIDTFADTGGKLVPIGFRDYLIVTTTERNNVLKEARGYTAYRPLLLCKEHCQRVADLQWKNFGSGIYVSDMTLLDHKALYDFPIGMNKEGNETGHEDNTPIYQKRRIAAVMSAVAIKVLESKEVSRIRFSLLTRDGQALWERLGKDPNNDLLSVQSLLNSPYIAEILKPLSLQSV